MKLKQKPLAKIGPIYEAFVVSLPFLSAIQFLTILTIFYNDARWYLAPYFPWITFPTFVALATAGLATIMTFVYKYLIPSIWTFRGKQLYGFESELMDEVRKLREELQKLKGKEAK